MHGESANKACPPGRVMAVSYTATPSRWADLNELGVKDVAVLALPRPDPQGPSIKAGDISERARAVLALRCPVGGVPDSTGAAG